MSAYDSRVHKIGISVEEGAFLVTARWYCGECNMEQFHGAKFYVDRNLQEHKNILHCRYEVIRDYGPDRRRTSIQIVIKCDQCGLAYHFEGTKTHDSNISNQEYRSLSLVKAIPSGYARLRPENVGSNNRRISGIGIIDTPKAVIDHREREEFEIDKKKALEYRKLRL